MRGSVCEAPSEEEVFVERSFLPGCCIILLLGRLVERRSLSPLAGADLIHFSFFPGFVVAVTWAIPAADRSSLGNSDGLAVASFKTQDSHDIEESEQLLRMQLQMILTRSIIEKALLENPEVDDMEAEESVMEPSFDLVPQETKHNFRFELYPDDDDGDEDSDNFELFPRRSHFNDVPDGILPRGRLGESDLEGPASGGSGHSAIDDEQSHHPGGRQYIPQMGGADGMNPGLPVAGDPYHSERFPPPFPPIDPAFHPVVPPIDDTFPPKQLDVEDPRVIFREVGERNLYNNKVKMPDGSMESEVTATCGALPWTSYLSAAHGSFGMVMIMLMLIYMCGFTCIMHIRWIAEKQNTGDKEVL